MRVDGGKIASESIEISPEALREEASAARAARAVAAAEDTAQDPAAGRRTRTSVART